MKYKLSYLLLLSILFVSPVISFAQSVVDDQASLEELKNKKIKSIDIQGNKTISIATILSKIKTRVGQDYLQNVVSDDLKRLYNTGYFSDVRVDREVQDDGIKVIVFIEEKPIIEEITFSKTHSITKKAIEKELKSQVGKFLDKKLLKDDQEKVKDMYVKKGLTSIDVEAETFVDEATNKASIHFIIREGNKIRIQNINIYGNDSYKDQRIRKVIKTKPRIFIIQSGYLKDDVLNEDMERIKAFYEQNGYIDVKASYEIDHLAKGNIDVNINIEEGKRYFVGTLNVAGNKIISEKEIETAMADIKEGGVFSRAKLSGDIASIRTLYFDKGYIFAKAVESTSLNSQTGEVDVNVDIEEGVPAYIEKIRIEGNTRTRDIVVRRELKMKPGDQFNGEKLKKSKEYLTSLGYFEDIAFDIEDTDVDDRKNLVVQVKEAKTGTFSFGGGFSTVDKIVGFVEIEQRNFDLLNWPTFTGGGQHISLRAEAGSSRNNYTLSFTEPWIFDHPVSFGFDVFRTERQREEDTGYAYDETRTGGGIRLGKNFTDKLNGTVSYTLENVDIGNFESGVSAALLAEEGKNLVSTLGFGSTYDNRDSIINPTKGWVTSENLDFAGGPFGGDKDFIRLSTRSSLYVPLMFKSVLELRLNAGLMNAYGDSDTVPIFERFFAGGARSIRGYDEREVGPFDSSTFDPIGGEAMLVGNIEYTVPIIEYVKLAAFFDIGNVWAEVEDFASGEYKAGTGLGLRVKTPIGPINLDYGFPLNDIETQDNKDGKFYFSVSRGF